MLLNPNHNHIVLKLNYIIIINYLKKKFNFKIFRKQRVLGAICLTSDGRSGEENNKEIQSKKMKKRKKNKMQKKKNKENKKNVQGAKDRKEEKSLG